MTSPSPIEVDVRQLGPLRRIGSGGQGTVYELVNGPNHLVYKEYSPRVVDQVDVAALTKFVRFFRDLDEDSVSQLTSRAAWPVNVVRRDGVVQGFVMPRAPEDFSVELAWVSGNRSKVLGQVQFLLNSKAYLRDRELEITDQFRLLFLRDTARTLALFHRLGITVGDLSPNNLLFTRTNPPRCFFIDCDAMRLGEDTVLEQVETPEWRVAELGAEELATPASDSHKLGLLTIRLFAGDQHSRDPEVVPKRLRRLVVRCLDLDVTKRPAVREWDRPIDLLLRPIKVTEPVTVPAAEPDPAPKPEPAPETAAEDVAEPVTVRRVVPPVVLPSRWRRLSRAMLPAALPVLFVAVIALFSNSGGGSGTSPPRAGGLPTGVNIAGLPSGALQIPTLPRLPYTPIPRITIPRLTFPELLCLRRIIVGANNNPVDEKVRETLSRYLCALDRTTLDPDDVGAPGSPLRTRSDQLVAEGMRGTVTVTGTSKAAKDALLVTARFENKAGKCRRATFTLNPSEGSYWISAISAPVAATGCT